MNLKISIVIPTKNRENQLKRLLESIIKSTFKNYEIIIVNDSQDDLTSIIKSYPATKIFNNKNNKGLAYSRNQGALSSKGKYVLFIDDDNIIDKSMLSYLFETVEQDSNIIAVGPLTYFFSQPKDVWFLGGGINMATSKAFFYRTPKVKNIINKNLISTDNLHNCFMLRKTLGDEVGWFDEKIYMSGTEFDLFQRIKKKHQGMLLVTNIKAKDFHDVPQAYFSLLRNLGFDNQYRVYYFQRNRGVLVGRYGTFFNKLALFFVFYPFFFFLYGALFIWKGRWDFLSAHIKATKEGYGYLLNGGTI
jgi:glycosyltransferase involved in cell wall biosynthesis